jgi:hypothetical protein
MNHSDDARIEVISPGFFFNSLSRFLVSCMLLCVAHRGASLLPGP